jgi:hypothetical protein
VLVRVCGGLGGRPPGLPGRLARLGCARRHGGPLSLKVLLLVVRGDPHIADGLAPLAAFVTPIASMPARSAEVRRQGASAVPAADRLGMDPELLSKTKDRYNHDIGGLSR